MGFTGRTIDVLYTHSKITLLLRNIKVYLPHHYLLMQIHYYFF